MSAATGGPVRIAVRVDDAGLNDSVNRGVLEAVRAGLVRNVSVMVPVPAFAQAAEMLREVDADVCLGLHVTLSSEWDAPRWGPVADAASVPSLLDGDGHFTAAPAVLHERGGPDPKEAVAEVEAQLAAARAAGLDIRYLDEHMGVGWIGLREHFAELAAREGLIDADGLIRPQGCSGLGELVASGDPGPHTVFFHPGHDDAELGALKGRGFDAGGVGAERDGDRRALLPGGELAALVAAGRVRPVRFDELV